MKTIALFGLGMLMSVTAGAQGLNHRYDNAVRNCLAPNQTYMDVQYREAPKAMQSHYKPSMVQRASFHIYRGIFDEFGGVVQGMLSQKDEAYVKPYLRALGQELKRKQRREDLSSHQAICIASCMVNQLMEGDEDVFPTTSMELAVARGKGFCRHFVLATDYILKSAGIPSKYGFSLDHIFFYFENQGKKVIFDPGMSDGITSCDFYDEVK